MKRNGLDAITENTRTLWNAVCNKYGQHAFRLAVNGLGEVILTKGYTEVISKGNRQIQKTLRELLSR